MKEFEDMTIRELKILNEKFKEQNPDIKTAQELLEELSEEDIVSSKKSSQIALNGEKEVLEN